MPKHKHKKGPIQAALEAEKEWSKVKVKLPKPTGKCIKCGRNIDREDDHSPYYLWYCERCILNHVLKVGKPRFKYAKR